MAKSNSEFKSIQKKLVAAVAMVLVASIMVVSSSYAWFTLSTAPEVTGIQTSVGSNGNLEMALRTQKDVGAIGNTDGTQNYPDTNNYWGNLVDLSHSNYHMNDISLAPARLNIVLDVSKSTYGEVEHKDVVSDTAITVGGTYNGEEVTKIGKLTESVVDGKKTYSYDTVTTKSLVKPAYKLDGTGANVPYLKTPVYGTDGRLSGLSTVTVINGTYVPSANGFAENTTGSWGVRAIGTTSLLTPAEMALRTAKRAVSTAITSSKNAASTSLREDSVKLANILINIKMVEDYEKNISDDDVNAIIDALGSLSEIADSLENAMKQAVIAVGVAQDKNLTADQISFTSGKIDLAQTVTGFDWTIAADIKADLEAASVDLVSMRDAISNSLGHANAAKNVTGSERSTKVTDAMSALLTASDFEIIDSRNGTPYSVDKLQGMVDSAPVTVVGVLMNKPIISIKNGIYANIAKFSGNYSAEASMRVNVEYAGINLGNEPLDVTMSTNVSEPTISAGVNNYYLTEVLNDLNSVNSSNTDGGSDLKIITDIYGYALDFAFRTNATGSSLLLQTEAKDRVEATEDPTTSLTQGHGSFMQFTTDNTDFTFEQLVNLMMSVRVVFVDDAGSIYGVAAMQGLKYEPVVTIEYETKEVTTGEGATTTQNHIHKETNANIALPHDDHTNCKVKATNPVAYVAKTEGHDMADENGNAVTLTGCEAVEVNGKTYIKAPLYLYNVTIDGAGKMTIGTRASSTLTALQQNVATAMTTVVYLDGDTVQNKDVAISGNSMTGTMNLQFASDAPLDPMDYTFTAPQLATPETAEITEAGVLKIKNVEGATGYKLYYVAGNSDVQIGNAVIEKNGTDYTEINLSTITEWASVPAGQHTLKVVAVANGHTDSAAKSFSYNKA